MIKLLFDDNDFKIAHPSDFFFSLTTTINFLPISAHIQVIVSLSLCSVTWALGSPACHSATTVDICLSSCHFYVSAVALTCPVMCLLK